MASVGLEEESSLKTFPPLHVPVEAIDGFLNHSHYAAFAKIFRGNCPNCGWHSNEKKSQHNLVV